MHVCDVYVHVCGGLGGSWRSTSPGGVSCCWRSKAGVGGGDGGQYMVAVSTRLMPSPSLPPPAPLQRPSACHEPEVHLHGPAVWPV